MKLKKLALFILPRLLPRKFGIGSWFGWLSAQRKWMIDQAFIYTNNENVEGDYIEFGVARGRTLIFAYEASGRFSNKVGKGNLFGFDSFQGFPEPKGVDAIFERFKKGEEDHGGRRVVLDSLKKHKINTDRINLVEGWYEDTLNDISASTYEINKARVVNVDCDMYESTKDALAFIVPLIQNGTVILFDDWLCYRADPKKGEQRAVHEWLQLNPNIELVPYRPYANVGQSFIVNLKDA